MKLTPWMIASTLHEKFQKLSGFKDGNGWCAIVSFHLNDLLKVYGYKSTISVYDADVEGHAWVECGKYIIDITADQYGQGPCFMKLKSRLPKNLPFHYTKMKHGKVISPATLKTLKNIGWPKEQKPLDINLKKLYIKVDGDIERLTELIAKSYKKGRYGYA